MAKGSKSKKSQRDVSNVANEVAVAPRASPSPSPKRDHREVQDNRTWDPDPWRPAKTVNGVRPRIALPNPAKRATVYRPTKTYKASATVSAVTSRLGFSVPHDVILCLRRAMRREVLHALKKTKKGAGAQRRRRNQYSDIKC